MRCFSLCKIGDPQTLKTAKDMDQIFFFLLVNFFYCSFLGKIVEKPQYFVFDHKRRRRGEGSGVPNQGGTFLIVLVVDCN